MKTKIIFLFAIACLFSLNIQAQDLGDMMGQLAKGIKPEAFKSGFDASEWIDNSADLSTDDVGAAGEQLSGLVQNLKPEAFDPGSMGLQKDLLSNLMNMKDPSKLVDNLKSLVNGLNPSMLASGFNKDAFLSGLGGLL